MTSHYGAPASLSTINPTSFSSGTGLTYHARIFQSKLNIKTKPQASRPQVLSTDFFSSLVSTSAATTSAEGEANTGGAGDGVKWFFSGVLNGWEGLVCLELVSLSFTERGSVIGNGGKRKVVWNGVGKPEMPEDCLELIAELRAPDYTNEGYSETSKGLVWWADARDANTAKRFAFGEDCVQVMENEPDADALAIRVHHIGHRYPRARETIKQQWDYHTACFIEWDHQKYGTIVEKAWVHGISGYQGRSQWLSDYKNPPTALYNLMPSKMKVPFTTNRSELRWFDVEMKNLAELKEFIKKNSGGTGNFIAAKVKYSADVTLENASRVSLMQGLWNYTTHLNTFVGFKIGKGSNCQTFSADMYGYLTEEKKPKNYSAWFRVVYTPKMHLFEKDDEQEQVPEGLGWQ